MIALLFVIGVGLMALPGVLSAPARRVAPDESARWSAGVLCAGAATVESSLLFMAAPSVLRTMHLGHWAALCEHALGPVLIDHAIVAWPAAALAGFVALRAAHAIQKARCAVRRIRVEPWLGEHIASGGIDVAVVPSDELLAVSVPGDTDQIVVSNGLVAALDDGALSAVIDHEAAHLRLGHRRYLLMVSAIERAFAWLPFQRRSSRAVRHALEEWADAEAAGESRRRRLAIVRAIGELRQCSHVVPPSLASHELLARQERLRGVSSSRSTRTRLLLHVPATVLVASAVLVGMSWFLESQHVLALSGYCPS